nr:hypothetical protein 2 [bacterium]
MEFGKEAADFVLNKMESMFHYLNKKYFDNPDFQKLDLEGKIKFVMEDIGEKLKEFINSDGMEAVSSGAAKFGSAFIKAMAKSLGKAIMEDPITALLFGAYVGLAAPGPIPVKVTLAIAVSAAPLVKKFLKGISPFSSPDEIDKNIDYYNDLFENPPHIENATLRSGPDKPWYKDAWDWSTDKFGDFRSWVRGYAHGGIIDKPHFGIVGEAGPEAIIPLSPGKRGRGLELWEKAGSLLGATPYANGGLLGSYNGYTAPVSSTASPVVNLNLSINELVKEIIVEAQEDINEKAEEIGNVVASNIRNVLENLT